MLLNQRARGLITVTASPEPSNSYGDTVCVAGVRLNDDGSGTGMRIYPVAFRHLGSELRFKKFEVIEVDLTPSSKDARAESYRPNWETLTRKRQNGNSKTYDADARGPILEKHWADHVRNERSCLMNKFTLVALAGAIAAMLSGCSLLPGYQEAPTVADAEIVMEYDCLAPNLGEGWGLPGSVVNARPAAPDPGRLPDGFEASVAYLCDGFSSRDTVTVKRYEGDLSALVAALDAGDEGRFALQACSADAELVPTLWLADAAGNAVRMHWPRNSCGKTKPGTRNVLADLTVAETITLTR